MTDTYHALQKWFASKKSQAVVARERLATEMIVNSYKPFRSLELVNSGLLMSSSIDDQVVLSRGTLVNSHPANLVVTDMGRLPFISESFDIIVCAHVQETSACAGEMFAEMSRVLIPGGLCVVFGFNPQGLWRQVDFAINPWWQHPVSVANCQALGQLFSLTTIYTDYLGFGAMAAPEQPLLRAGVRVIKQTLPSTAILYKLVMRKEVMSQTPVLVDEASMMHSAGA